MTSRGGVRFEFHDVDNPNFAWKAAMRGHAGFGPTLPAAIEDLIAGIESELAVARDALKTVPGSVPPAPSDR